MATGGETNYSCCSSCLDDGRNTVARHYCVECEMYFCTKCVKYHNKMPALKKHKVNDVNTSDVTNADDDITGLQSDVLSDSGRRLRCTIHQGKLIDTFCKDHNEVCCGSCAMVKHRSCTTLPIAIAAKDFKSSPEIKESKDALTENLVQCKQEKEKRSENLESIGQQKLDQIENMDRYEEKIIARIKELANISRNEIRTKYEEHKSALDTDIQALDVVIVTNTEYVVKLEQTDEEQLFTYAKNSKTVTKDGEILLEAMTKDWKEREIKFCFDEALEKHVLELKALGRVNDHLDSVVKEYKACFHSNVNVQQSNESNAYIFDICVMGSNDVLVADHQNMKLKRFNSNLQFKDEIVLSGLPISVCNIDKNEVAVRMYGTGVVQFVSVGQSMQLTSTFKTGTNSYGMTYDSGSSEIFACENNKVSVYSKIGQKLRTYDKDTDGEKMFTSCRQIALCVKTQDLYVSDGKTYLIILDKNGTLKKKVALSGVSEAWPLCLLPGSICLTGSDYSGVIVQLDKDGNQVGNLIDTKNGRTRTFCAVYDCKHSRLIVAGSPCVLYVYTLSAK